MNSRRKTLLCALVLAALALTTTSQVLAQGPLENPLRSYADVADRSMPAVVNISTDKVVESNPYFDDPIFRRFFNMPDDENHGRGGKQVQHSLGSGVVISPDGYIITNNHVVENADRIIVNVHGEQEYEATVIGTDPPTDVALIKVDAKDLPAIIIGDSNLLRVGDQVLAIGNPFGVGQTVTKGIVSALNRNINLMAYSDLIQTDAAINPGNSGGALVNMEGELVGMNAAILSRSGGSQGIGFAIPTSMIMRVVDPLKSDGKVARAYLGVLPQEVNQAVAQYYGLEKPEGVLIAQVNEDTPAKKAGLEDGDIILSVDGRDIRNPSMLRNVISLSDVGHEAKLEILREGKRKTVDVKLDALPEQELAQAGGHGSDDAQSSDLEGVSVRELTERVRSMTQVPDDIDGIYVMAVDPTSNSAREGLQPGDVIQEVNRQTVTTIKEFQAALGEKTDRPVFMRVYRPQAQRSIFIAVPR
ncbi:hypothetical protein CO151_11915 [bacterium CG_4_9_14_3_um_filter_65_15]|nr:MAG: hypothetical protein CO151_11915 [bacterium CG_4_9_14_3_um_filter_65_15]